MTNFSAIYHGEKKFHFDEMTMMSTLYKTNILSWIFIIDLCCLTPLSVILQLYHGDQFQWWKKPEYPERTTDHGQATGKLYHLRLRVECTLFCNLQSHIGDRLVGVVR